MGFACKTGDGRRAAATPSKKAHLLGLRRRGAVPQKAFWTRSAVLTRNFFAYFEDVDPELAGQQCRLQKRALPHGQMLPHLRCQHRRGAYNAFQKPAERPQQHSAAAQERTSADAHFKLHPAGRGLPAQSATSSTKQGFGEAWDKGNARGLCSAQSGQAGQAPPSA